MKAIVQDRYGAPDVLELREIEQPVAGDDEVLVRVRAVSVNPYDWHFMRGEPYLMRLMSGLLRPKVPVIGVDLAGQVEAVGEGVTGFQPGDAVFGMAKRACAEYVCASPDALVAKPADISFEQAATVPIAGLTALQGLKGRVQSGQTVLVNGAAGGVGTFAVQIAKSLGTEVTAVCSTRNVDLVRSIGADRVIDYTRDEFTTGERRYDLLLDMMGNHPLSACRRILMPDGVLVIVGGPDRGNLLGPLAHALSVLFRSKVLGQKTVMMLAKRSREDLQTLADLMASGAVTPVIDRSYGLSDTAEAIRYLEQGHARGKVVITV
jgi:NADPH:quinone reductase-like Zn-dependent oxidoreductase